MNHFTSAMKKSRHPNAGGGRSKGGEGTEKTKGSNALLAAHAQVTGADWSRKALEGSKH